MLCQPRGDSGSVKHVKAAGDSGSGGSDGFQCDRTHFGLGDGIGDDESGDVCGWWRGGSGDRDGFGFDDGRRRMQERIDVFEDAIRIPTPPPEGHRFRRAGMCVDGVRGVAGEWDDGVVVVGIVQYDDGNRIRVEHGEDPPLFVAPESVDLTNHGRPRTGCGAVDRQRDMMTGGGWHGLHDECRCECIGGIDAMGSHMPCVGRWVTEGAVDTCCVFVAGDGEEGWQGDGHGVWQTVVEATYCALPCGGAPSQLRVKLTVTWCSQVNKWPQIRLRPTQQTRCPR